MKFKFGQELSLLVLIFALLIQFPLAQTAPSLPESATSETTVSGQNETLVEDERLPFMEQAHAQNPEPSTGGLLIKTLGSMFLIVGLIFFAAWGLKKFGFVKVGAKTTVDSPNLAVLNSVSVGTGRTLAVVQFGERTLLLGSTAQSFTLLAEDDSLKQTFSGPARSVGELLADSSFEDQLTAAQHQLGNFGIEEEQI